MKYMHLVIRTAEKEVFSGEVGSVQLPGSMGSFEVLYNHAPIVSTLDQGTVCYRNSKGVHRTSISSGVVEVVNNKVSVLVDMLADVIDKA